MLTVVALQAEVMLERDRLRAAARAARVEHERAAFRAALLVAVSHDLRTALAAIKAGVGSLRSTDLALAVKDQAELLATVEDGADRLQSLIDNLLDMSRLDSGQVPPLRGDVVARAVACSCEGVLVDVLPDSAHRPGRRGAAGTSRSEPRRERRPAHPEGIPVLDRARSSGTQVQIGGGRSRRRWPTGEPLADRRPLADAATAGD